MTKKRAKHKKPHVLGTVHHEKMPILINHPVIDPVPMDEAPPQSIEIAPEEHVIIAVPKSEFDDSPAPEPKSFWEKVNVWIDKWFG